MAAGVLLVDDHAGFRRRTRRLPPAAGFQAVGEAVAGAEIRCAEASRPSVAVPDVLLPGTDGFAAGFAAAGRLAASPDPPAAVAIPARSRAEPGDRVGTAPARGFLPKERLTARTPAEPLEDP